MESLIPLEPVFRQWLPMLDIAPELINVAVGSLGCVLGIFILNFVIRCIAGYFEED